MAGVMAFCLFDGVIKTFIMKRKSTEVALYHLVVEDH